MLAVDYAKTKSCIGLVYMKRVFNDFDQPLPPLFIIFTPLKLQQVT